MKTRLVLLAVIALAVVGAAFGLGALLGRGADASPAKSVMAQVLEGEFPLSFQGILLDGEGKPVSNSGHSITFAVYNTATGSGPLWSETQTVFTLDGLFTAELGVEEELDPSIFSDNPQTFLSIRIGRDPELMPRFRLAYAPYAVHALTADNVLTPAVNARRAALLRWYEANESGIEVAVDDLPGAMAFDGTNVWVATRGDKDKDDDDNVTQIRASDGMRQLRIPVGKIPTAIAFDGINIWVANRDSNSLTRFRPDGSNKDTLPLDGLGDFDDTLLDRPIALAFDGAFMWVVNQGRDSVSKIRTSEASDAEDIREKIEELKNEFDHDEALPECDPTEKFGPDQAVLTEEELKTCKRIADLQRLGQSLVADIPVGDTPSAIAFDGENIWVLHAGQKNVSKINPSQEKVVEIFEAGTGQDAIAFDGEHMWIVDRGDNSVAKVRASDGEEIGTFGVGNRPVAIAFDGSSMWVVNRDGDSVTKLRVADGKELGTFAVGDTPTGIAFDGVNVWVSNEADGQVVMR